MLDKTCATIIIKMLDREIAAMQDNTHWGEGQEAIKNHCIRTMQRCKQQVFGDSELFLEAIRRDAKEAEVRACINF